MLSGLFGALSLAFMREIYGPAILERKTRRLRKETGNKDLHAKLDSGLTPKDLFLHSVVRPSKMLVFSPIVLLTSIYVGLVSGYLFLLFTTFDIWRYGRREGGRLLPSPGSVYCARRTSPTLYLKRLNNELE